MKIEKVRMMAIKRDRSVIEEQTTNLVYDDSNFSLKFNIIRKKKHK